MSHRERSVRGLADWMLRLILLNPFMRGWHDAVRREMWLRDLEAVIAETANEESGPYPVVRVEGMH
ncbi:MAG: hypothetical protein RL139_114 [Gemmatimonadota bacterium]|jgi:hypothetical protein